MKVLVAVPSTNEPRADDFSWTLEGELVHLPAVECASCAGCDCERSFVGVATQRPTTTAVVAERELSREDVLRAVLDGLVSAGHVDPAIPGRHREGQVLAHALTADLLEFAASVPVGAMVGRYRDRLLLRSLR